MESQALSSSTIGGVGSIERNNLILVLVGTLFSCLPRHFELTLSFIAGGLLTIVNLRLWRLIVGALTGMRVVSRSKMAIQILLKVFGMMGLLAIIVLYFKPEPIPFLLGLSTLVVAIVIEGFMGIFRRQAS